MKRTPSRPATGLRFCPRVGRHGSLRAENGLNGKGGFKEGAALHEKRAPHSLCGACSLEVPATLIEPECEIDRFLLRIGAIRA